MVLHCWRVIFNQNDAIKKTVLQFYKVGELKDEHINIYILEIFSSLPADAHRR